MGFRYDIRHLSSQAQHTINSRETNSKLLKQSSKKEIEHDMKKIHNIAIFAKLGLDATATYNGLETLKIYEEFCIKNKAVWFSTNSLSTGMSQKKRQEFIKTIKEDSIVEIYFAVGKGSDGKNDIVYRGEVLDIQTDAQGISSPDKNLTPEVWQQLINKIWIKLESVKPSNGVTSNDFIVESTGNSLSDIISRSQYQFGYIKNK
ncbi:hypothetical protein CACET_c27260 [Clostridium aceticum]|uniref:Uncharacterized protein n=1 Tax=Clostridium aceticum TaxID=84022 RepID=A0A0D8I982_9CLOT|nr:hypothetical protein [Clostridium aceticum]AKL96171.1 hypothetical protein CACET_c27260 [Clostridium aceticum]KJF26592.1 hypothetical protein TZ02_12000 [Clostridium aceticum]